MMSLSYWVKIYVGENCEWEGLVYGREEDGNFKLDLRESDQSIVGVLNKGISDLKWEPAWMDVTDSYRIPHPLTSSIKVD